MNWLKYKKYYFAISAFMIVVSVVSLYVWRLNIGVDFTGGTIIEYRFDSDISTEDISNKLNTGSIQVKSVQKIGDNYLLRLSHIDEAQKNEIVSQLDGLEVPYEELKFENVGPSIGPELVKKTMYAILIASIAILAWVAYQFKSLKFGAAAVIAMFHDTFILLGSFAILGKYFDAEVDFLIVTAILTTLSFSVHDTIVVFDRIREISKKEGGLLRDVSNKALTETMVRSLNNSFTISFMLIALILLGGTTIKWFAVALLIGTMLGTYSSPFVAVPLLNVWNDIFQKIQSTKLRVRK